MRLPTASSISWLAIALLAAQLHLCFCIKWLGLHHNGQISAVTWHSFCHIQRQSGVLTRRQLKFCRGSDPSTVSAVVQAAKLTVAACESQFRNFRWNCRVLKSVPDLAPELRSLTAEQALVHALSGFALAATFASECSRGLSRQCGCGSRPDWAAARHPGTQFKFEGCHANLRAGQKLARRFLSAGGGGGGKKGKRREMKKKSGASGRRSRGRRRRTSGDGKPRGVASEAYRKFADMVNRFNYRVGIRSARHSEAVQCKCHGPSASCTLRTCHRILHRRDHQLLRSAFIRRSETDPLDLLLDIYDKKLRKTIFDETGYQGYEEPCSAEDRIPNPLRAQPTCESYRTVKGLPEGDVLLFHEHSLDYCATREGRFPGTAGRECLPDRSPEAARLIRVAATGEKRREILCSVMCCGRTYASANLTYEGSHPECEQKTCRLLQNPFRVVCTPCQLRKSFCH